MGRTSNPLESRHKEPNELRKYLSAANDFWMEAIQFQVKRCEAKHEGPRDYAFEVIFYATAVQRLREVARMAASALRLREAKDALSAFDERWPNFKNLRNVLEHILLPASDSDTGHLGITFFPGTIADLRPGTVDYLIDTRDAAISVAELYQRLAKALGSVTSEPR